MRIFKFLSSILLIIVLAFGLVYAKNQNFFRAACSQPILYSIGSFDAKFGLTEQQFLADVNQASAIWELPANRNLFEYSQDAKFKINLIYDARQEATDRLKKLGIQIENTQSSYDSLKARYNQEISQYTASKQQLDQMVADYNADKQEYDQQVAYWNSRGGAPKKEFDSLKKQQEQLNATATTINQKQAQLNQLVDDINALVNVLNNLAKQLNLNVSTYNNIGESRGSEFEEGLYISDSQGKRINIYEFSDQKQLIRLLAHELGHALGLEHVDDPKAIMYRLNEAGNDQVSSADISELTRVCHL